MTFLAYALTCIVLTINLLALWISSGAMRVRSGVAINTEDAARYGVPVSETDPPAVARLLRAHRNAEATIYPFLVLGLLFVLAGGTAPIAVPIFVLFVLARLAHSIVYVRGLQPWRTITFALSAMALVALMLAILFQF
jgi:prostaglandin-E synthase 1